ncbi:MAG: ABC transporter ATP-binding protein [Gemmatimonadetes bacterium]|nr:ABC transporter ATP-binding protein [Gemmatimonadota bacterium]
MAASGFHDDDAIARGYDTRLMRRLLAYTRPYRALATTALLLLMLEGGLQLVGPLLTRRVIDVAIPGRDAGMIMTLALVFAASLGAQFACAYGETVLTGLLGQRIMQDLRRELFTHLQRLPIPFFDRTPVGRLTTRVTQDIEALNELFTAGVVAGLGDLFTLAAIGAVMWWTEWRLALAAFAVIPFVLLTSWVFRLKVREAYREIRVRLARINAFVQERAGGMRVVQLFGREPREVARFDRLNKDHLDIHLKSITVYALYFPAIEILTSVALASLLVSGASRVLDHALTVGTVAAFLQLVRRFFQPLQDLSDKYNTLQQAMAASERVFTLLDTPATPAAASLGARAPSSGTVGGRPARAPLAPVVTQATPAPRSPAAGVSATFEDVWFAYREPEWVLQGVSFSVRPGDTLALVGHTGAGKSTVVSLLLRFYEPQRGRILLDGTDIRELPVHELRARIGFVQQDIFLFAGDIAGNIRLSSPLTDAEVRSAAVRVGADRVVERLPQGYAQVLGERGASLSVGERQLLSFARAVAANPALLVLDEATSAVDSEAEAAIQRGLAVLMEGRTTIAIAHRLSTILAATEILVLHHGRIVERGTHRTLLEGGGLYERLYRLQVGELSGTAPGHGPAA